MLLLGLAVYAASLVLALALTPWVRAVARRRGFVDEPGPRKIHDAPVPLGGGIAVAAAVLLPLLAGLACAKALDLAGRPSWVPAEALANLPGALSKAPQLLIIAAGAAVLFAAGLVDDLRDVGWGWKLLLQVGVAAATVAGGVKLSLFMDDGPAWTRGLASVATVLWIVGITNAFNFLDNMDGLSTGVAAIASLSFLAVAVMTGQDFIALFLAAILGACVGFLPYNFSPASIYLGDAGSTVVGYLLSVLTVLFTFYREEYPLFAVLVPVAVLAVPVFDTAVVVWIRLREGRSPFRGDNSHLSHRLVALGLSRPAAVLTIWLLTLVTGVSAVLLYQVQTLGAVLVAVQVVLVLAIVVILETAGRRRQA